MSKTREGQPVKVTYKRILGAATVWPLIYVIAYFLFAFWVFFSTAGGGETPTSVAVAQSVASVLTFLTVLLTVALFVIYIALIARNDRLDAGMKMGWIIVVVAGSVAGMLVYWYLQVRSESEGQLGMLGVGLRLAAQRQSRAAREKDGAGGEADGEDDGEGEAHIGHT